MEKTELAGLLAREDTPYRQVVAQAVDDFLGTKTEAFGKLGTASLAEILLPRDVDFTLQKRLCNTLLNLAKEGKVDRYAERGPEREGKGPMKGKMVRPWLWHAPTEPVADPPPITKWEPGSVEQALARIEAKLDQLLTRG